MGLILGQYYLFYFLIVIVLFVLAGLISRRWIISSLVLLAGVFFPVLDAATPRLWFNYHCSQNLMFSGNISDKKIKGFYSEGPNGFCDRCSPAIFLQGYQFIEGKINLKSDPFRMSGSRINKRFDDYVAADGLYRFSLVAIETEGHEISCRAPNVLMSYLYFRDPKKRGVKANKAQFCIAIEKLEKIVTENSFVTTSRNSSFFFGNVRELSEVATSQNNVIYRNNIVFFKGKTIIPINNIFYAREEKCANYQNGGNEQFYTVEKLLPPANEPKMRQ